MRTPSPPVVRMRSAAVRTTSTSPVRGIVNKYEDVKNVEAVEREMAYISQRMEEIQMVLDSHVRYRRNATAGFLDCNEVKAASPAPQLNAGYTSRRSIVLQPPSDFTPRNDAGNTPVTSQRIAVPAVRYAVGPAGDTSFVDGTGISTSHGSS